MVVYTGLELREGPQKSLVQVSTAQGAAEMKMHVRSRGQEPTERKASNERSIQSQLCYMQAPCLPLLNKNDDTR